MGIKGEVSRFYEPDELEKFAKQLKAKGIVYDYADIMDVS